jgi:hypothetical protein
MASSSQIKPGETGNVTVELDSGDYKGKILKEIWLYTNDQKNPRVSFIVKADIIDR